MYTMQEHSTVQLFLRHTHMHSFHISTSTSILDSLTDKCPGGCVTSGACTNEKQQSVC